MPERRTGASGRARHDGASPVALYEGDCTDELCEVVSSRLSAHQLTVRTRLPIAGRFRAFREGDVGLYDLRYGAGVRIRTGELPDFYSIILPSPGSLQVRANGRELPDGPYIAGPGDQITMDWADGAVNEALVLSRRAVEEALAARLGDLPRELPRFHPALDPGNPAVRAWLELAGHFRTFAASALALRSPLGTGHFERLLVDGLLDAQAHSLTRSTVDRGPALLPSALRRAVDFCAEHADEAVSVADIARAARVSLRTLREGFRRHLDTTPLAYLRRVRLDRAHHDLLAIADGRASGTVTEIACRWGFTHLGRFSADYRRAYGRSPSEALGRGC
ncbi:AraC family transcriptional regulator [Streptomyces sp. NRRL S-350]|uniref:AraC family transcriptional regulator n=1 Tax=Streptomyces sp. NRRL S-350 TaxID=1463902 RepID=UPI00068B6107|nr:AraC family transcriptional regulator [Streptomyces sp. NRRL S-350]